MAELVVFDVYWDWSGPATLAGRILLLDDLHWRRLPIRQPPNIWGDNAIPMLGNWCKFDESMGLTAMPSKSGLSLQEIVAATPQNRQALAMYGFFPALQGKQGKGRNAGTNGGLTYRIIQQSPLAGLSYDMKLQIACGAALEEMSSKKLLDKVVELFTMPNILLFGVFAGSYLLKNPTALFTVCRAALGRVMAWVMILDYCNRFGNVFDAVDRAETVDQLKQAGLQLADILLSVARDAGLVALSELIQGFIGQKGKPVGKRAPQTTMNRTAISDAPPPPACQDWRSLYQDNLDLSDFCLKQAKTYLEQGLLDDYALALQRAFELRIQAHLMRVFIVETIHHIEVMKRLGDLVSPLGGRIKGIMDNPLTPRALKVKAIQMEVETWTASEGFRMTPAESAQVAEKFLKTGTRGKYDWSRHDCDITDCSKFRGFIADGMKNPIRLPRDWTIDDLQEAARGTNPKTHKPFTDQELVDIFGVEYSKLQQLYGSSRGVFQAAAQSKNSIEAHNTHPQMAHHHPDTADDYMESAHDSDHACEQDRSYRPQPLTPQEILQTASADRLPWVKIGLASLAKLGRNYNVVDPVRAVTTVMLNNYGQTQMLQEMGITR